MARIGAVAIGRNEGERLKRCLSALVQQVDILVYVDSGSNDGSIEFAKNLGVDVVALDTSLPFTAARARNTGFKRVQFLDHHIDYVQFVDGDCEVAPDWIAISRAFLEEHPDYAVACGRRRERFPEQSIYNQLCDDEWNTPIGDAKACGGDALIRAAAFTQVSGFRDALIAGEEPELCVRLRKAGWKIRRLDHEMTLHDAAITRFSQWWQRNKRAGYAYAEGAKLHGYAPERHWVRERNRALIWGLLIPISTLATTQLNAWLSVFFLALYPLNTLRIAKRLKQEGNRNPGRSALFLVLSKFPETQGILRYFFELIRGKNSGLIEYKG